MLQYCQSNIMGSSRIIASINSVVVFVFVVALLTVGFCQKVPNEYSLQEDEEPQIVQGVITTDKGLVEDLFINDETQENIIHLHQKYYDTFIIKRYATKKALMLVQSDDDEIHYCEEWNLTNETFIPASVFLNAEFRSSGRNSTVTRFFHTVDLINVPIIPYSACQDIPPSLLAGTVSREKRFSLNTYGNWCGRWDYAPWGGCCPTCQLDQCLIPTCKRAIDNIDTACARYTVCHHCGMTTPNKALPHCDCVRDIASDIRDVRCNGSVPECYSYRNRLYGFMSNHKCWGRLMLQIVRHYQCGFKQSNCRSNSCTIVPQMCEKKEVKILNNFNCLNYATCEETFRKLG